MFALDFFARAVTAAAKGRKDSAAHWEVAWETTEACLNRVCPVPIPKSFSNLAEAWWLRPIAFTVPQLRESKKNGTL